MTKDQNQPHTEPDGLKAALIETFENIGPKAFSEIVLLLEKTTAEKGGYSLKDHEAIAFLAGACHMAARVGQGHITNPKEVDNVGFHVAIFLMKLGEANQNVPKGQQVDVVGSLKDNLTVYQGVLHECATPRS